MTQFNVSGVTQCCFVALWNYLTTINSLFLFYNTFTVGCSLSTLNNDHFHQQQAAVFSKQVLINLLYATCPAFSNYQLVMAETKPELKGEWILDLHLSGGQKHNSNLKLQAAMHRPSHPCVHRGERQPWSCYSRLVDTTLKFCNYQTLCEWVKHYFLEWVCGPTVPGTESVRSLLFL